MFLEKQMIHNIYYLVLTNETKTGPMKIKYLKSHIKGSSMRAAVDEAPAVNRKIWKMFIQEIEIDGQADIFDRGKIK